MQQRLAHEASTTNVKRALHDEMIYGDTLRYKYSVDAAWR